MPLVLALALSVHLGASGMNAVHPALWLEREGWKAGAYLNSHDEVSLFAGRRFGRKVWVDVGLVTGYDSPIGLRTGIDLNDHFALWALPAPESLVLGVEIRR
jgi:hypothetical protein